MVTRDILKNIPLFQNLSNEDLTYLGDSIKHQTLRKGEVLFNKGSEGNALYIVKHGKIKILLSSHMGDEVVLAIFSDGDFFGEMALLDGLPRSADAIAIENTELLILNRNDFLSFLYRNNNALRSVLQSLSQRLRSTDNLLEDTCFLNISARFAKKLVALALKHGRSTEHGIFIDFTMTQKDMASMVGATRESINKELRVLREKGLVSMHENSICIHNLERLRRRAH